MANKYSESFLVNLIDDIAPLNNQFRLTTNPINKIEIMWEIGKRIDQALIETRTKLHELLYTLYDPHGKKMAYITRDLGSYSYRIFKYFESKNDIKKTFPMLSNYTLFREAIPLLFNDKYSLSEQEKAQVIALIQQQGDTSVIQKKLIRLKQKIQPMKNPRDQHADQYQKESALLANLKLELLDLYRSNEELPSKLPYSDKERRALVQILMVLSAEAQTTVANIDNESLSTDTQNLLRIAESNSQNKARFRKWAMDTHSLLTIAEALHALESPATYKFVRVKFIKQ